MPKSSRRTRKRTRKVTKRTSLVLIVLIFFILVIINSFYSSRVVVSKKELSEYINAYFDMYEKILYDNSNIIKLINNRTDKKVWDRTVLHPSNIEGIISKKHGVAIMYEYTKVIGRKIDIKIISNSIEYYVWPNMYSNINNLRSVFIHGEFNTSIFELTSTLKLIEPGLLIIGPDTIVVSIVDEPFNLGPMTAILVQGILIHQDHYIIKGSNNKIDWTVAQAKLDAVEYFLIDTKHLLNERHIKDIENRYKIPILMEIISKRMNDGTYVDYSDLFTKDYDMLKILDVTDETLSDVLDRYYNLKIEPSIIDIILNLMQENILPIIGSIISGVTVYYLTTYQDSKKRK